MSMMQDMLKPPAGLDFDFTTPPGEPALVPADGVTWRVFANPVTMFIGGVAAVLLEMAEPSVRSGVWDHSSFRTDPGTRLRRTGFTAMITVYGARSRATEVIAHVVGIHDRVRGTTPDGTPYRANDPRLLDWVQATATFGFTQAYHRFARPLTPVEQDAAFVEGQVAARLYGDRRAAVAGRMGPFARGNRAAARTLGNPRRVPRDHERCADPAALGAWPATAAGPRRGGYGARAGPLAAATARRGAALRGIPRGDGACARGDAGRGRGFSRRAIPAPRRRGMTSHGGPTDDSAAIAGYGAVIASLLLAAPALAALTPA